MTQDRAPAKHPRKPRHPVIAQHAATLKALPFSDTRDFDEASRGFLGTLEHARIANRAGQGGLESGALRLSVRRESAADGRPQPVAAVAPQHEPRAFRGGARRLSDPGLDIANMTLIEGDSGVIVVDTLTSIEGARAAMELYFQHRGKRPVAAVIFTHTHTDHWGGARGVLDDDDAGRAARCRSSRRICSWSTRFRKTSSPGRRCCGARNISSGRSWPRARAGRSIADSASRWRRASVALLRPTDLIMETGDKRTIDGLEFEFQMAPNTEAPAEMHFFIPRYKLLNLAENCTHNFHNLLPFRGADVRDALAWSKYLGEAAADVGRQGGCDVRPAPLAGMGHRAHRHHDPPAARPL